MSDDEELRAELVPQLEDMEIIDSLERTTRRQEATTRSKQLETDIEVSPDLPFRRLMRETREQLQIYKSFDPLISLLRDPVSQFAQTIKPVLDKVAHPQQQNYESKVYSFDRANSGAIDPRAGTTR
jgi:hypothetical protein